MLSCPDVATVGWQGGDRDSGSKFLSSFICDLARDLEVKGYAKWGECPHDRGREGAALNKEASWIGGGVKGREGAALCKDQEEVRYKEEEWWTVEILSKHK